MEKIFGTDGVRGVVNKHPMTAEMALKIGMAAAIILGDINNKTNKVVIGKDTRLSGYMLETALTAGLTSMGKDVLLLGPMPTPAVAMLTQSMRADLGIMISASHNPHYDNGIKLFDSKGYKLSDSLEQKIEELLQTDLNKHLVAPEKIGKVERLKEAYGRYIEFVKSAFTSELTMNGLKIVLDCANGAAYKIAPIVFYELGATVITIGDKPNGLNINDNCGSTHISNLKQAVLEHKASFGVAFDGDADRVILVDERGEEVDGDKILAVLATDFKHNDLLQHNKVVGTVMANKSLENYLNSIDVEFIRTKVGDRYVFEALKEHSLVLGGEQSGHILLPQYNTTGDALLVALKIASIISERAEKGILASKVLHLYQNMPQVLLNVKYNGINNPLNNQILLNQIKKIEKSNSNCRFLIRQSGTENLIRVMVEGENLENITQLSNEIVNLIKQSS
jgi:phosphoglucosamine mutase